MNINELKAFLGEKPKHLGQANSLQNQLRDEGLRQAISTNGNKVSLLSTQFSSQTSVGLRVFNDALNSSIELNQQKPNIGSAKNADIESTNKSLFDFEEIAKNVLNFVGGAIKNAQGKGADEQALNKLFDQASSGVLKGIALAQKDLAGISNDEIENGIANSKALIEQGIQALKDKTFGVAQEAEQVPQSQSTIDVQSAAYQQRESGELIIRTRDGDKVSLRFEDFEQFEFNRQLVTSSQAKQASVIENLEKQEPTSTKAPLSEAANVETQSDTPVTENAPHAHAQTTPIAENPNKGEVNEQYIHYQSSSLSFSVEGELDEGELKAVGDLVANARDLAIEFFDGDIDVAFQKALELGYDDQELTSFALQLTKEKQVQVVQTYESVSHFKEGESTGEVNKLAKPVAHYLEKMLDVVEESRKKLEDGNAFENMINDLINQMGEVHTPDLIHAINRFHSFNQKLLDNLPPNLKQQA